ncbi:cyanophycinase [Roseateles saccharophilus]|uniref:Cyanophycinase n=1 Tax=Roseateles saccharophilus TaxID=304 RepID=A0A4R3VHR0_ROSSA|nr:cyanophycinase [Roseateles saccharophilus]TCV03382.1 cyanophycinase [Roseateles saccharophilus]
MLADRVLSFSRRLALLGLLSLGLVASGAAWAGSNGTGSGALPTVSTKDYDFYLSGSVPALQPPRPATTTLVLMGGGTDVDDAFRAMIAKARGGSANKVDIVILRTSGSDGYNAYLMAMDGVGAVGSIVIKSRAGASAQPVLDLVNRADVLFIAGGDQSTYVAEWAGTPLEGAMKAAVANHVPFGGTSAGLAVLGQFDYSALYQSVTSTDAMANPYNRNVTLDRSLLNSLPYMAGVITDSHLITRDRMGRLVTFMGRLVADGWASNAAVRGIGLNEQTAVVVDNGIGTVVGNPDGSGGRTGQAYFLQSPVAPITVKAKTPLTYRGLQVEKRVAGGSYDLVNWPTVAPYSISVESGVLTSNPY